MSSKALSAGDNIEARCTRCREVTNHTIVAMIGEEVKRVMCNVCNGEHNYRAPKVVKEKAAPKASKTVARAPRKTKKESAAASLEEWVSATADAEGAAPYDMNGKYRVKDLMSHPVFGIGVVKVTMKPNKMEVLFKEGVKLLRCML